MNSDEIKNLVPVLVALLAPLGVKYGFSVSDLTAFLTGAIGIGLALYTHWNMKKVPETAVAIQPTQPASVGGIATGRIVGALAFGFLFASLVMARDADAQSTPAASSPAFANSCDPTTLFKGLTFTNLLPRFKQCNNDDLATAIKNATASGDNAALSCLAPVASIAQGVQAGGLFTAFQAFRDAKLKGVLGNCLNYVNTTLAP